MQRLVDFYRINQIGGNGIQLDLTYAGLWRGNGYSVDHGVAQTGFRTADLHVFAFALIALDSDRGHAAKGIGNIRVWQRNNNVGRQNLQNVFGCVCAVDGLCFAEKPFAGDDNFIACGADLESGVNPCCLPRSYSDAAGVG